MRAHARFVNVRAIIMCAFYNPLKFWGEIPSKRNILYDIKMRRDLEKVDVALLQSSFE